MLVRPDGAPKNVIRHLNGAHDPAMTKVVGTDIGPDHLNYG
jgi:hypothetical protein